MEDKQTPPAHLSAATAQWWVSVMTEYALEPHHIRLLTLACEAYDSAQEARETLQREGKIYIDRFDQPKPRPEVTIQRDSAIGFARMLRELDLDISSPTDRARPPSLVSNRGL
jgi:P27 family predicted phage terminase small subunit